MAFHSTVVLQGQDSMVALCYFDLLTDVGPGVIAHGLLGLPATGFAGVEVTLCPIIGEGGTLSADIFYVARYFVLDVTATEVWIGKTNVAGSASAGNCCQVVLHRAGTPRRSGGFPSA